jgi:hypothetical protein
VSRSGHLNLGKKPFTTKDMMLGWPESHLGYSSKQKHLDTTAGDQIMVIQSTVCHFSD